MKYHNKLMKSKSAAWSGTQNNFIGKLIKCDNEQIDVGEDNLRPHVKADNMEIVNFDLDAKIINLKQKLTIDKIVVQICK